MPHKVSQSMPGGKGSEGAGANSVPQPSEQDDVAVKQWPAGAGGSWEWGEVRKQRKNKTKQKKTLRQLDRDKELDGEREREREKQNGQLAFYRFLFNVKSNTKMQRKAILCYRIC